jgi:hypothetical protein
MPCRVPTSYQKHNVGGRSISIHAGQLTVRRRKPHRYNPFTGTTFRFLCSAARFPGRMIHVNRAIVSPFLEANSCT